MFRRRDYLKGIFAFSAIPNFANASALHSTKIFSKRDLVKDLKKRTFDFFWQKTNPETGLTPDRWPSPSASSIAGVGMALCAYAIGVENKFITRASAARRTLKTLHFLFNLQQGESMRGIGGHKGFFYHFLDTQTGERFKECELSTIDTALLMAGILFVGDYYYHNNSVETQIRQISKKLFQRVDWKWAIVENGFLSKGWHPETGFINSSWNGFDECMLLYILAIGAEKNAIDASIWRKLTNNFDKFWGEYQNNHYLQFASHFGNIYSHMFIDFKNIKDDYCEKRQFDYFENSVRASNAQRDYAILNPQNWRGYGKNIWGISACDGPLDIKAELNGKVSVFRTYAGRGASVLGDIETYDDGTIAPYAAIASINFTPSNSLSALWEMYNKFGHEIYGKYGFFDSFNLSFQFKVKPQHGKIVEGFGWVDTDYLAIDQGPILMMLENYDTSIIWKIMRKNKIIRRGLNLAGFHGAYLNKS